MNETARKLKALRPSLWLVSPLTAAIVLGYGIINILLGVGLFSYVNPSPNALFAIINSVMTYQVWGSIFIVLGLFKLYSLAMNNWRMMRISLIIGIVVKSIWAIALFFRYLDGGSILLLIIWLFFAYVQLVTYINFTPTIRQKLT